MPTRKIIDLPEPRLCKSSEYNPPNMMVAALEQELAQAKKLLTVRDMQLVDRTDRCNAYESETTGLSAEIVAIALQLKILEEGFSLTGPQLLLIASDCKKTIAALLANEAENVALKVKSDDFERKGKDLCQAYGNALIAIRDLKATVERLSAPISKDELTKYDSDWDSAPGSEIDNWTRLAINNLLAARKEPV